MERMKYAPTLLSSRDYAILKNILRITQIHVETLLIMTFVRWLDLPLLATVEVIVLCVAIFIPISKGFWKEFERTYAVAEAKEFSSVRVRPMQEAV